MDFKKMAYLMLLITSFSSAENSDRPSEEEARNCKILSRLGLPLPDGGVQVVPRRELGLPKEILKESIRHQKQQTRFGYIKENLPKGKELLELSQAAPYLYKKESNNSEPYSTHMRSRVTDIKMAYTFVGIPESEITNLIGFVPQGVYRKEGWSGAVEFFENTSIGVCAFMEDNFLISHGSVKIAEEAATNEINGKATLIMVAGEEKKGFLYSVEWFDKIYARQLECVNMKYSKKITQKVINLARRIDSN